MRIMSASSLGVLMAYVSLARFKGIARGSVKEAPPAGGFQLHKEYTAEVITEDDGDLSFILSTSCVDRSMDTVNVNGWDIKSYLKNPVVLWAHNSWEMPIGRTVSIGVSSNSLKARVKFVPIEIPLIGEKAAAVRQLCEQGFLSACSVGFRPLEWKFTDDKERGADDWFPGVDFLAQELLEWSIVSIPSNPEALAELEKVPGPQSNAASPANTAEVEAALESLSQVDPALARIARERAVRQRRARLVALS